MEPTPEGRRLCAEKPSMDDEGAPHIRVQLSREERKALMTNEFQISDTAEVFNEGEE